MELTLRQEQGLRIALERYKNKERYTVISGYAGTGKSTLVKFIVEALVNSYGVNEKDICYCAFTGKATQVLSLKGNKNTYTLHKLLYESYPNPDGTFSHKKKLFLNYKIVFVDEVSMAPTELVQLLLSHNVYVIFCGDPFQLPPVESKDDNHLLDNPHIFLDEVMRQAKESEIIRLTMDIRDLKMPAYSEGQEVRVHKKNTVSHIDICNWADQVLVGTNTERKKFNQAMRTFLDRPDKPVDGDKVICARNYWKHLSSEKNALINGTIGYLNDSYNTFSVLPKVYGSKEIQELHSKVITDTGDEFIVNIDRQMLALEEKCVDEKLAYKLEKRHFILPLEFVYGYAITCHRSQGSEWEKVAVFEEKFPFDRIDHARWLYTAATRASSKLVIVR